MDCETLRMKKKTTTEWLFSFSEPIESPIGQSFD